MSIFRNLTPILFFMMFFCGSANPAAAKDVQVQIDGSCNVFTFHFHDTDLDKLLMGFEEYDVCIHQGGWYGLGAISRFHNQKVIIAGLTSSGGELIELFAFSYPLVTGGTVSAYETENGTLIDGGSLGTYTVLSP